MREAFLLSRHLTHIANSSTWTPFSHCSEDRKRGGRKVAALAQNRVRLGMHLVAMLRGFVDPLMRATAFDC